MRQVATAVAFIVWFGFGAVAIAQVRPADVACKKTETQAECHTRLKCQPNEELEDCQKRLLKCNAGESLDDCKKRVGSAQNAGNRNDDNRGDNRDNRGDNRDNRGDNRGDRGDERSGREEQERRERANNRGDDRGDQRNDDRGDDRNDNRNDNRNDRSDRGRSRGERGGRRGQNGSHSFEPNKTFGLGLELGEPAGLNGKYFLSRSGALDFGLGWIYRHYYYDDGFHIYADYLYHPVSLVSAEAFELPLYIGVGARYWDFDYCDLGLCTYHASAIGLRVPIGVAFDFNNVPLDIFIQAVPVLDFLRGDYDRRYRREHFGVDFSVGIRFWFK